MVEFTASKEDCVYFLDALVDHSIKYTVEDDMIIFVMFDNSIIKVDGKEEKEFIIDYLYKFHSEKREH